MPTAAGRRTWSTGASSPSRTRGRPTARIAPSSGRASSAAARRTTPASSSQGAPADYDEWGPGWTYAELEPYLRRAEHELRTRRQEIDEISPWHAAFAEAAGDDNDPQPTERRRASALECRVRLPRPRPRTAEPDDHGRHPRRPGAPRRRPRDGGGHLGRGTAGGSGRPRRKRIRIARRSSCAAASARRAACPSEKGSQTMSGSAPPGSRRISCRRKQRASRREHPLFMGHITVALRSSSCPEGIRDLFVFPGHQPGRRRLRDQRRGLRDEAALEGDGAPQRLRPAHAARDRPRAA